MSFDRALRRPVSTRHAFALALDLAIVRDPLHSFLVPLLLRGPWIVALGVLAGGSEARPTATIVLLGSIASLGASLSWWAVDAMLRFRARSVFNTPHGVHPAPVLECYERGLRRLPWLYLTEFVRNLALTFASGFMVLPGVYLGYKLAFSTEAVVLDEKNFPEAIQHSLHLSRGRFERWLEFIVFSVGLVVAACFLAAVVMSLGSFSRETWAVVGLTVAVSIAPVIQYAWTFFYLRLVEVEEPRMREVGPFYAAGGLAGSWGAPTGSQPRLTLVEPPQPPPDKTEDGSA
jgi:hypothetical protein